MTRLAAVDARADQTLIAQTYSRTDDYLWLLTGTPVKMPSDVTERALGEAVVRALRSSRVGIERPDKLDGLMDPLLKVAGVRSQRAYYEGTRSVGISEEDDGTIVLEPRRRRAREFLPMPDREITIRRPSPEELGAAVRQAIERSA